MTIQAEKVRYLLLDTSMQYDVEGPSAVALVAVTQPLLNKLTKYIDGMRRWKQEAPDVYETYFWCGLIEYYKYALLDELQLDLPSPQGVILPEDFNPDRYESLLRSMECHQLVIRLSPGLQDGQSPPAEIEWYAIPKHGSHPLTTNEITLERLQAVYNS